MYYIVFAHPWSGHVSNVFVCATAFSPVFTGEPCLMFTASSCCSNLSNWKWKLHNSLLSTYIPNYTCIYRIMCETFSSYNASVIKICNINWINHKKMLARTLFMKCKCVLKKIMTTSNDYYVCVRLVRALSENRSVWLSLILCPTLQNSQHKFGRPQSLW